MTMIHTVYFATNRDLIGTEKHADFGETFNPDGPAALRFGRAEVPESCFGDDKRLKDIRIEAAPEKLEAADGRKPLLGSAKIFDAVRREMQREKRDAAVFVHGYANTFRNALRHAAVLRATYNAAPLTMFLVSWPSDGKMVPYMSYYSDRTDAKISGLAMGRAFIKLADYLNGKRPDEWCGQRLHLIAHSMGNYALRHAMQGIRGELGDEPPRLFDNVFLFAADEDDDSFEHDHKLRLLPRIARAVQVYFNPGDQALLISDKTKGNPDRVGSDGPRLADDLPRKLTLVDCRDVARSDPRDEHGHDYHRYVPEVVADVNAVLKGALPDEIPGRVYVPEARAYRIQRLAGRTATPVAPAA